MNQIQDILKTMDYGPAPEEDAIVRDWLKRHKGRFGHFIGGKFTAAAGDTFGVPNPATGETLAEVAVAGKKEVDAALQDSGGRHFKIDIERGRASGSRWLYQSTGLARLLTVKAGRPVYRLQAPEAFNALIGVAAGG